MATSDFSARPILRGGFKVPTTRSAVVAAAQVFEKREPVTSDANGRIIRAGSNPASIVGISMTPVAGLAEGTNITLQEIGDGKLWVWETFKFARNGSGTLVAPQQSDIWDLAGLVFAGGIWVLDSGATNKIIQIVGFAVGRVAFRFLEGVSNGTLSLAEVTIGTTRFYSNTPGNVTIQGGLSGKIDQRGTVTGSPVTGPDTANFNATRMTVGGTVTLNNPTYEPPAGETMVHNTHFVSDGTSRVVTLGSKYRIAGGATTVTTTAVVGEVILLSSEWDGTNWRSVASAVMPA